MKFLLPILSVVLLFSNPETTEANTHFVDPGSAQEKSDGSREFPWKNLRKLFEDNIVEAGDRVVLLSGEYGDFRIRNRRYDSPISIAVEDGHKARFSFVGLKNVSQIRLSGLTVSSGSAPQFSEFFMVEVTHDSEDVTIENFDIFSSPSIAGWTKEDWNKKAVSGIYTMGTRINIQNNTLKNVNFGIAAISSYTRVIGNRVENFSGDGLRGLGDHSIFENNLVKNCFEVNDNHDDGFQSWSVDASGNVGAGAVTGVILRKNTIINYEDENQPYRCKLQGIGLFGGMYVDWVIENNLVIVDHWHGITVMGAKGVRILNNTVFDPDPDKPGPAWIQITDHPHGKKSEGNFVANNLASAFSTDKKSALEIKNMTIRSEHDLFVDPDNFDFSLKAGSRAIDAGMPGLKTVDDLFGNARPSGKGLDIGAVEYQQ